MRKNNHAISSIKSGHNDTFKTKWCNDAHSNITTDPEPDHVRQLN